MSKKKSGVAGVRIISTGVEQLDVKLTEAEERDRGQQLATIEAEMRAHVGHTKSVNEGLKAEKARLDSELCRLAGIVRRKAEPRPVDVELRSQNGSKVGQYVRIDSGDVIRERALTEAEMQGDLFEKV